MKPIFMRLRAAIPVLLFASLAFVSCSKDNNRLDPNPDENIPPGGPYFVSVIQGTGGDDTSFVYKYDANNRIIKVVNTTLKDSVVATYNSAGNLTKVLSTGGGYTSIVGYTYNDANQLISISRKWDDSAPFKGEYRDSMVYNNGVIAKRNTYVIDPGINNGKITFQGHYAYEVTDGNITRINYYGSDGQLSSEKTLTYNNEPNVLKGASLLNIYGALFIDDIANEETWFNKNLLVGLNQSSSTGPFIHTFAYSYNDEKQLARVVWNLTFEGAGMGNQTWKFFY